MVQVHVGAPIMIGVSDVLAFEALFYLHTICIKTNLFKGVGVGI